MDFQDTWTKILLVNISMRCITYVCYKVTKVLMETENNNGTTNTQTWANIEKLVSLQSPSQGSNLKLQIWWHYKNWCLSYSTTNVVKLIASQVLY